MAHPCDGPKKTYKGVGRMDVELAKRLKKMEKDIKKIVLGYFDMEMLCFEDLRSYHDSRMLDFHVSNGMMGVLDAPKPHNIGYVGKKERFFKDFAKELEVRYSTLGWYLRSDVVRTNFIIEQVVSYGVGLVVLEKYPELETQKDNNCHYYVQTVRRVRHALCKKPSDGFAP